MVSRLFVIFVFVLLLLTCAPEEEHFSLIDRETPCTIVLDLGDYGSAQDAYETYDSIDWFDADIDQDDICRHALAAIELQHYLCLITGFSKDHIPIVATNAAPDSGNIIFLGSPQHPDFKKLRKRTRRAWKKHKAPHQQDFRIDSFFSKTHRGLMLSAHSSIGVLYAVYELLSQWGVRWYAPEKEGEYVPHIETIDILSVHYYGTPSFKLRGFWIDSQRMDEPADSLFISWMGRNRLNLFSNTQGNISALKLRGILLNTGRKDVFSALLKPDYQYRYNHPTFPGDDQYPMDPYIVSEYYGGDLDGDKKLTYAEAHPEWFGIEEDTSDHRYVDPDFSHICLSYPEAVKEFAQTIVDKLNYGDWKTCDIIDLWAPEIWCTCQKCQNMGNDADKLLYLMYHVSRALDKARKNESLNRPIFVHGYAQNSALDSPTMQVPKDFTTENTAVFLFTGPRCFNHCIIDIKCTAINIWFAKNLWSWLGGTKIYDGDINIAENYNAGYFNNLPAVHSQSMTIDIPAFAEIGVRGINFQHVRFRERGVQTLTNYQFARQAWDAHVDIDTLRQEFYTLFYPGIAKSVEDFMERFELAMSTITTWRYFLPQHEYATLKAMAESGDDIIKMNERFVNRVSKGSLDFNTLWENTYHLIFEARFLMDELLARDLVEPLSTRIKELQGQLEYAERVINLYDNVISFFTHSPDEQYIKEEALIRLAVNVEKLEKYKVTTIFGEKDGLTASGLEDIIEQLNQDK